MFPGILFLLPLFVIFVNLEKSFGITLYGTYIGLIITYLTFSLPFSIWMLVGYFNSIPRELEESALTEGATPIGRCSGSSSRSACRASRRWRSTPSSRPGARCCSPPC